jgi:hypothetical protein
MDVSIFGYKFNLEVLILIGVVYLILVGHTVCGCCNMGRIIEGATGMAAALKDTSVKKAEVQQKMLNAQTNLAAQTTSGTSTTTTPVTTTTSTEGFTGANINYGESSLYNLNDDQSVDTSSWSAQNMTVVPGQPLSKGVKQFLARKPTQVPLPEGEMFMFANTQFKPECCPNTYSNSSGCACLDSKSYNYLVTRGGNNVPYSEY